MSDSPFKIDVLNPDGTKRGDGPLINILQLNTNTALDKIGGASFVIPSNDPRATLISPGCRFDIFDSEEGYLGRYIYKDESLSEQDGRGLITVNCWDILKELTRSIVGFRRNYNAEPTDEIIADLISDIPNWTSTCPPIGDSTVTYQGQTHLQAIEELAKRNGYHFRLGEVDYETESYELQFGAFGNEIEGLRFVNLDGQDSSLDGATEIGVLKGIKQSTNDDDLYNLIIAVGAGTGKAQLQLKDGETGGFYTVQSRTRPNGAEEFYIEDSASSTAYGTRELVLIFDQIRPISNTVTAKNQARTELLLNAEAFLNKHNEPRTQLDNVTVYALRQSVQVGDKVLIRYKSLDDEGNLSVNVDGHFWVLKHNRTRNAQGQRISNFQLGSVDRLEKTDTDIIADTVKGTRSEKLWIKPVPFRFSDTYTDFAANSDGLYQDKDAVFSFTIDDTVTEVTRVLIEWRTKPLFATSVWSNPGATVTLDAAPTNPHSHALDLSTVQLIGLFTVLESANFPTDVSLELNGDNIDDVPEVDYLDGGAGPWNDGGSPNAALFVRMDITDLILNAVGGIYQTFEFRFRLTAARSRDVGIPYYTTSLPQNNTVGNQGIFELKIITQGVAQAIP